MNMHDQPKLYAVYKRNRSLMIMWDLPWLENARSCILMNFVTWDLGRIIQDHSVYLP